MPFSNYYRQFHPMGYPKVGMTASWDLNNVAKSANGQNMPTILYTGARRNLINFSMDATNALYSKIAASVKAKTDIFVDGTLTGQKIVEDTTAATVHHMVHTIGAAAGAYNISVFVKPAGRFIFQFQLNDGVNFPFAQFNLNALTATPGNGATAQITQEKNGWLRCSVACPTLLAGNINVDFLMNDNGGAQVYNGDGVSGFSIAGFQVSSGLPVYPFEATPYPDLQLGSSEGVDGNDPTFLASGLMNMAVSQYLISSRGSAPNIDMSGNWTLMFTARLLGSAGTVIGVGDQSVNTQYCIVQYASASAIRLVAASTAVTNTSNNLNIQTTGHLTFVITCLKGGLITLRRMDTQVDNLVSTSVANPVFNNNPCRLTVGVQPRQFQDFPADALRPDAVAFWPRALSTIEIDQWYDRTKYIFQARGFNVL